MPLISVVIPCYNVEQYIDRCMESVIKQTIGLDNLEIILINDASTDRTLEKLKSWENKYSEHIILVTYEKNIKQGGARNIGMRYATAEYVGFVDADDWIEPDTYEILYQNTKNRYYDMVSGKFIRESEKNELININASYEIYEYEFQNISGFYKHNIIEKGKKGEYGCIVTSIYRLERIIDNNVWFPENTVYEDNYWFAILKLYIRNLCIVDRIFYHYFVNPSSTVTIRNAIHHLDRLPIEITILETYQKLGVFSIFKNELEWEFIQRFYLNT